MCLWMDEFTGAEFWQKTQNEEDRVIMVELVIYGRPFRQNFRARWQSEIKRKSPGHFSGIFGRAEGDHVLLRHKMFEKRCGPGG